MGQQTQAAKLVEARISELHELLTDFGGKLEGSTERFKGSAAQGFGEAINLWFENTAKLGESMAEYAAGLYAVDMIFRGADEGVAASGQALERALPSDMDARLGDARG
ncbi:WXG100 family type VII secretion target [Nocardioides sp. NPDC051685]|uniref:WXG100 family type VII secretion target n=1 Tax=Nocardioides sp. NPDC051685 TaxID=3364334 RepID=UPI0037A91683